jgi:hypothetical protein
MPIDFLGVHRSFLSHDSNPAASEKMVGFCVLVLPNSPASRQISTAFAITDDSIVVIIRIRRPVREQT